MQGPTMIELPLISFDSQRNKRIKPTYFSSDVFKDKLIRDWEESGKSVSGMCVVAKQIKIKGDRNAERENSPYKEESDSSEYWIINLSKESLVAKLEKAGFGVSV